MMPQPERVDHQRAGGHGSWGQAEDEPFARP